MNAYLVIYRDDMGRSRRFECKADDAESAMDLCRDAHPDADIVAAVEID